MEDAEEKLRVAQVATSKARDDGKTENEERLKYKVDYVAEVGRMHNEIGKLTKQLCHQIVSAAAGVEGFRSSARSSRTRTRQRHITQIGR